ncbi:uncharacterized protein LOC128954376 [Oppia nitens]|uniref:uncharacterized protein LOC128954376 n=1 Tax=Oppia nitens TaxID=1686743 RepID=UPI0023D9B611|nr:uncharacterized protein LOC128954376 [Oppia nitens]
MTTTTAMKDSFDRFGDDLAKLLLTYLPIENKLRLQSVSKQWLALIFTSETYLVFDRKLLKRLSDNSLDNSRCVGYQSVVSLIAVFELLIKKCPNITTLTINDSNYCDNYFQLIMKYCYRLRHISLKSINHWSTDNYKIFYRFCSQFGQQLLTFKFDRYDSYISRQLYESIDLMPNLKTLDIAYDYMNISRFSQIFSTDMSYVLPKTLQSTTIRLNNISVALSKKFPEICGQQITSLDLSFDRFNNLNCNYNSLIIGLSQMKRLVQLKIVLSNDYGDSKFPEDLLTTVGRNCRRLKALKVEVSMATNTLKIGRIFSAITEHMSPQLRRLSVDSQLNFDKILLLTSDSLKRFHRLTHLALRLHYWRTIYDQFFRDIHRNLPRLQSIYFDRMVITKKESILAMGQLAHLTDALLKRHQNGIHPSIRTISREGVEPKGERTDLLTALSSTSLMPMTTSISMIKSLRIHGVL